LLVLVVPILTTLESDQRGTDMKKVIVHKPGTVRLSGAASPKHVA
jgi:hypothetical protein